MKRSGSEPPCVKDIGSLAVPAAYVLPDIGETREGEIDHGARVSAKVAIRWQGVPRRRPTQPLGPGESWTHHAGHPSARLALLDLADDRLGIHKTIEVARLRNRHTKTRPELAFGVLDAVHLAKIHHAKDCSVANEVVPLGIEHVLDSGWREIVEISDGAVARALINVLIGTDGRAPALIDHEIALGTQLLQQLAIVLPRLLAEHRHAKSIGQPHLALPPQGINE